MAASLGQVFPPPEQLVQFEPEEVGMFVWRYLCLAEKENPGCLNRYNRGRQANEEANLGAYKNAARLPGGSLDKVHSTLHWQGKCDHFSSEGIMQPPYSKRSKKWRFGSERRQACQRTSSALI
jgi:hypothetical protein